MQTISLELGERSYPIYIGENLLTQSDLIARHVRAQQVLVVTNDKVAPLYLDQLVASLVGFKVDTLILPDGEKYKNLETLNRVFDELLVKRHNRTTTLIALGGGVIGDMTGFAAACYQRGVQFIQIPTTLLAQVDSSVGGKTGVNHRLGKNMIGAFYQPQAVIIDTLTLATLPSRELRAGFAEVLKYGLICDAPFYGWLKENFRSVLNLEQDALAYVVEQSCRNKASVVAQDEREAGVRAILNLGHTFGHAIETFQSYQDWLHGEAVAAGMVMAADLSWRLNWLSAAQALEIKQLVADCGLPVAPPEGMSASDFEGAMAVDKKVMDGQLRLVLLRHLGQAVVYSETPRETLEATLVAGARLCEV